LDRGFYYLASCEHVVVDKALGEKMVSVMIPIMPTLASGYVVFVREDTVRPIAMPSEQALKLIISGGLIS